MLLLLNEHGDPSFIFLNLSSYNVNNQLAKFEKNLSAGSISSISSQWLKTLEIPIIHVQLLDMDDYWMRFL